MLLELLLMFGAFFLNLALSSSFGQILVLVGHSKHQAISLHFMQTVIFRHVLYVHFVFPPFGLIVLVCPKNEVSCICNHFFLLILNEFLFFAEMELCILFKFFAIRYIQLLVNNAVWLYHLLFWFLLAFIYICAFREASDCRNLILGGF